MGDVILGVDFTSDKARERFLRRREAIGLSDDPAHQYHTAAQEVWDGKEPAPTAYLAPDPYVVPIANWALQDLKEAAVDAGYTTPGHDCA